MTPTIPIILERDNVNDESVILIRWHAQHGAKVELDTLLAEVETSKANVEVYAPASGYLVQNYRQGAEIPVSAAIGLIADEPPSVSTVSASAATTTEASFVQQTEQPLTEVLSLPSLSSNWQSPQFSSSGYKQRVSPVAIRMIADKQIPMSVFASLSVVRKQDVLDYLAPPVAKNLVPEAARPATLRTPIKQPYQQTVLSKMKRSEGANLAAGMGNAVASAITVTTFTRGLRQILGAKLNGANPSAVFVYEGSRLLRKYPTLNAVYSEGSILQYEQVNVGFAMDDGRGLKVATITNADQLSLQEISDQLRDLTVAYLEDKLSMAQISNATFTISDLSGLGVSSFHPLISENQSGILGIGGEQFVPDSQYGFFNMTLTFDHQLSNGRIASLFLNDLKERLQNYEKAHKTQQAEKQQLCCVQCFRSVSTLKAMNQYLLVSEEPAGYLCTLCAGGY